MLYSFGKKLIPKSLLHHLKEGSYYMLYEVDRGGVYVTEVILAGVDKGYVSEGYIAFYPKDMRGGSKIKYLSTYAIEWEPDKMKNPYPWALRNLV